MQDTLEEMQTSQEELKSSNEELQSTNEELQSTNEELTSSKEEMQSMNEELQTLNAELQSKVDDFSRVNNDMKNLLNSTDIATLFLDKELNIRRFTIQATKIIKLIKSDIGRPFTDLVTDLIYPELSADALEVLKTLVFIQKPIPTKDGRWFNIRIMPYRTLDDRIDGLVITFINISELKKVELKLDETEKVNNLLFNLSSDILIKLSTDLKIADFNPTAEKFFGMSREDVLNRNYIQLFVPETERKGTENNINKLQSQLLNGKFKMQVIAAGGTLTVVKCSVNMLLNSLKMAAGMILSLKK
jgi:two-component system CheB/CheR fusion protein